METRDPNELTPLEPPTTRTRSRRRSVAVVVLLAVAIGALLSQGLLNNLNYFETVQQAMSQRATLGTRDFRLEGVVSRGSIARTANGASFYLDGTKHREIFVEAHGQPPQLFQNDIPVVVDGHFTSVHSFKFIATQIIVKHTSDYVASHPKRVKAPNGTVR